MSTTTQIAMDHMAVLDLKKLDLYGAVWLQL